MANNFNAPGMGGPGGPGGGRAARMQQVVKPKNMKATLFRLFGLMKGNWFGIFWVIAFSLLASGSAFLSPWMIGKVVTAISQGDLAELLIFSLLGIYVCDWLVRILQQFVMATVGQKVINNVRIRLFEVVNKLPLSFFDKYQHGELMSRLTNDVDNISSTISSSLAHLLTSVFTVAGIFVVMVSISPILTGVAITCVLVIFVMTNVISKKSRKLFVQQQKNLGAINGHIEESIGGLSLVKAFCREEKMEAEFEKLNDNFCKTAITANVWSGLLMPLTNVVNNLSYVFISVLSGVLAVNGAISIGMISSFLLYVKQFARPFIEIANIYNSFQTAVAGAERVFEIFDEAPEPADKPDAIELKNPKGDIELKNVSFGYVPEKLILKDINLKIKAGTKVAIVGETGSGKTTLVNLLTRFYDVTSGSITLDGHDLRDYKMSSLRDTFGVVLQDSMLFVDTVKNNICYGNKGVSDQEIYDAAKVAVADGFIERLSEGYDTYLEMGGKELSQGERQLITIARAVVAKAPILILDEATSNVDTVTEQKIRTAMLNICSGRTSFIIAHRLSTIRDSDVILVLKNGSISEMGNHDELLKLNGDYARMFKTQTGEL